MHHKRLLASRYPKWKKSEGLYTCCKLLHRSLIFPPPLEPPLLRSISPSSNHHLLFLSLPPLILTSPRAIMRISLRLMRQAPLVCMPRAIGSARSFVSLSSVGIARSMAIPSDTTQRDVSRVRESTACTNTEVATAYSSVPSHPRLPSSGTPRSWPQQRQSRPLSYS